MKEQVFETETVYNLPYILGTLWEVLSLLFLAVVIYFIIKLYRKLIKFLDRNTPD
ncbi:hypothetical protein ABH942_000380 [Flavobacterium sp. 28YEA47A]